MNFAFDDDKLNTTAAAELPTLIRLPSKSLQ